MSITPMISISPLDLYRPTRYSVSGSNAGSRLSTTSSDASSLHRTSSTASNTSTSASSVGSVDAKRRPQHRKTLSGSSFTLPRVFQPFHKKAQSQPHAEYQRQLPPPPPPPQYQQRQPPLRPRRPSEETLRWSTHVASLPTIRPSTSQWQCSDLVVKCKDDVYHVDRTIMCHHSRWFSRICAIMRTPKASKNVIDLSADDSDAVAAMMQYCYQLDYTDRSQEMDSAIDEVAELRPHVDVYMLAERYGCPGLKKLALQKFGDLANHVLMVNGSEEQLLRAIRAIYQPSRRASADELRRLVIKICADHVEGFISGNQTTMALVFESMDSLPEFRSDLFEEMSSRWK
ncbi:hypothetical protein CC86DRAFT_158248 [Ophiobolus disseminans]|uniref:BTB domain-containing protein n=1 Tax=Ophiobolus disseminans TaxID=1469910 RepID=A0A6A6ZBY2_9PLEO|nr:hypothetical protein CC86DRAFT_158248 [Ophiobolus disseminans]